MISFWVTIFFVFFLFVGKHLFKRWFNPIFLYVASWSFIIYLYDLKLLAYSSISGLTWIVISFAFFSFLFGVITVYLGRSLFFNNYEDINYKTSDIKPWSLEKETKLKKIIIITALIGLLVSLQHWYVLINEFGSIGMVFLSGGDIYSMRVGGEHFGKIPYFNLLSYVSVFLSAIYSAYRNKFTYLIFLPLFAVILTDAASFARAGVFFAFVLFGITFITARYFFKSKLQSKRFNNNKNIIVATIIILIVAMGSVSLIRLMRNPMGDFKSTSIELKELSNDGIISNSIYLYFSSPLPVLSAYLDKRKESAVWGENTFYPVYNNLNRFGANVNLKPYPKGYFIPMWVNSATYIRELDVDFGPLGIFIIPFLIGFLSTYFWYKLFSQGSLIYLTLFSYTSILLVFSIFYIGTRLSFWFFGFIFSIIVVLYFEKTEKKSGQISDESI